MTHDVTDDLLSKNNDPSAAKKKSQNRREKLFSHKLDKLLMNEKKLADDLEKYCYNKRLKKNIYKMDILHCAHNGQKQGIDQNAFTSASCDYERIPRVTNDPVINSMYKRVHAPAYQELMNHQADQKLLSHGVMFNNIYENHGSN